MESFDALFLKLRDENELPPSKKLEMVKIYYDGYSNKIFSAIMPRSEMEVHLEQLNKIGIEVAYYADLINEGDNYGKQIN